MTTWTKLPPIEGFTHCLNCPPRTQTMPLSAPLCIGFGSVGVTKDGEYVWSGDDENVFLQDFEKQAVSDPAHDWRVGIDGPLYSAIYQRHDEGEWVLIERREGFA